MKTHSNSPEQTELIQAIRNHKAALKDAHFAVKSEYVSSGMKLLATNTIPLLESKIVALAQRLQRLKDIDTNLQLF